MHKKALLLLSAVEPYKIPLESKASLLMLYIDIRL